MPEYYANVKCHLRAVQRHAFLREDCDSFLSILNVDMKMTKLAKTGQKGERSNYVMPDAAMTRYASDTAQT